MGEGLEFPGMVKNTEASFLWLRSTQACVHRPVIERLECAWGPIDMHLPTQGWRETGSLPSALCCLLSVHPFLAREVSLGSYTSGHPGAGPPFWKTANRDTIVFEVLQPSWRCPRPRLVSLPGDAPFPTPSPLLCPSGLQPNHLRLPFMGNNTDFQARET